MDINTTSPDTGRHSRPKVARFVALEAVTRPSVDTEAAAHYLMRRPQTLRKWACSEEGPIRPIRVYGRLAWPVADLRRLLGVAE